MAWYPGEAPQAGELRLARASGNDEAFISVRMPASWEDTSTCWPTPVRAACCRATRECTAASAAPWSSYCGTETRTGGRSGSPVSHMGPDRADSTRSGPAEAGVRAVLAEGRDRRDDERAGWRPAGRRGRCRAPPGGRGRTTRSPGRPGGDQGAAASARPSSSSRSSTTERLPRFWNQNRRLRSGSLDVAVERPAAPAGVAAGRLDLDDVGAEVGEEAAAEPAALGGQVEHAVGGQRPLLRRRHVVPPVGAIGVSVRCRPASRRCADKPDPDRGRRSHRRRAPGPQERAVRSAGAALPCHHPDEPAPRRRSRSWSAASSRTATSGRAWPSPATCPTRWRAGSTSGAAGSPARRSWPPSCRRHLRLPRRRARGLRPRRRGARGGRGHPGRAAGLPAHRPGGQPGPVAGRPRSWTARWTTPRSGAAPSSAPSSSAAASGAPTSPAVASPPARCSGATSRGSRSPRRRCRHPPPRLDGRGHVGAEALRGVVIARDRGVPVARAPGGGRRGGRRRRRRGRRRRLSGGGGRRRRRSGRPPRRRSSPCTGADVAPTSRRRSW